jgi:hypothetical protein
MAAERWTRARATAERMGDVRGKGAMLRNEEKREEVCWSWEGGDEELEVIEEMEMRWD